MIVHGVVAPGFASVRDSFESRVSELGETGAAFSARVKARTVVDLWAARGVESRVGSSTATQ
jgi:hypothetical protein